MYLTQNRPIIFFRISGLLFLSVTLLLGCSEAIQNQDTFSSVHSVGDESSQQMSSESSSQGKSDRSSGVSDSGRLSSSLSSGSFQGSSHVGTESSSISGTPSSVGQSSASSAEEVKEKPSYIFDPSVIRSYQVVIDEKDWEFLDALPGREEYVEATLVFEGDTIQPVGVRYKGSVGGWVGCTQDIFNQSTPKLEDAKCSVKIKFNWKDTGGRFYGLRKLQLHSQNLDGSKLHDRLAYHLYNVFDVPASRSSSAHLYFNDTYMGLYGVIEQVDKEFVEHHFPDDSEGNLFKEAWPVANEGMSMPAYILEDLLKTNEDSPDVSQMVDVITQFLNADGDVNRKKIFEKYFAVDEILRNVVVDRAIANDDGVFKWYCSEGVGCYPHNLFWYQEPATQKLHLIPWDMDNAFDNVNPDNIHNTYTLVQDAWNKTRNECEPFDGMLGKQRSAACDDIIHMLTLYEDHHNTLKEEFYSTYMNEEYIFEKIDEWVALLDLEVKKESKEFFGSDEKYREWEAGVALLKSDIKASFSSRGPQ
ncbi:MAG: CotH kinase family protein [Fibrobacterales bacterium]